MAKVKINNKCIPIDQLETIEKYAKKTGQTRANVYYHIKAGNIPTVKIGCNSFIILEKPEEINRADNQEDSDN